MQIRKTILGIAILAVVPVLAQTEKDFATPPADACSHVILGWDGEITPNVIGSDLDAIQRKGFRNVIIEPGYNMERHT